MDYKEKILLAHGSGGRLTHQLIKELFVSNFKNPILNRQDDSAVFSLKGRLAFTTDSFVVSPLFFPGGDIGKLAIFGTINDLAVMGAKPIYLTTAFIIEEGLELKTLEKIVKSMKRAAEKVKIKIVGGDLKVVERGSIDKIFISASGIGIIPEKINISSHNARVGDLIIINGFIGEHSAAVMSARGDYKLNSKILSDCSPLNGLIEYILKNFKKSIHVMRDPTRGGIATTLNEIALSSNVQLEIYEDKLPIRKNVKGFCEILGIDPLYMTNEGKVLIFVEKKDGEKILKLIRGHPQGRNSSIIGRVIGKSEPLVLLKTSIGSSRILNMLTSDQLPRIC